MPPPFSLDDVFGLAEEYAAKASLERLPPKFREHHLDLRMLLHPLVDVIGGATNNPTIVITGVERQAGYMARPYSIWVSTHVATQRISVHFPNDRDETHLLGSFRARYQASLGVPLPEGERMIANVPFKNSFEVHGGLSVIVQLAYDVVKERTEPVTVDLHVPSERLGRIYVNPPMPASVQSGVPS